ncbi:MAG: hsp70 family protein [Candidatus Competibacteraceae bacterium]|nr:hsp70 family protein [Candidatus Competibacteraceae bacterium]
MIARKRRQSRYLVGIDLGTTHTVVAYADTAGDSEPEVQLLAIDQLVAPGEVAARPLLPSLRYHPAAGELVASDLQLPWSIDLGYPVVLGEWARVLGSQVPGRLVASAKSWLSHSAVDRTAPILPWGGATDVVRVSPVDASAGYLAHIRAAWNHRFPRQPLEKQDLVLTVPASFDEAARSLTVEAAHRAGLGQARLLEEPQAACYDWLHRHQRELDDLLAETRLLLVCDVGGGTTDLTLIQVEATENGPQFTRIGVGDHLMLGGDNMDLTLAHTVEKRLGGERLSAASLSQLIQQCRSAKERLLAPDAPERATVTVLGAGSRLIGGSRSAELSRDEVRSLVVDGFLPIVESTARPHSRRGGIVEFGLPYTADPAISRHIAAFLAYHAQVARTALGDQAPKDDLIPIPDTVLLNGGVFHSESLTDRLLEILTDWRGAPLCQLKNAQPDLAVARGAVAYGMARRGQGLHIGGGSARSYFLRVESDKSQTQGVCLLPRGTEEDRELRLTERTFSLRLGEPVQFHLVSSTADIVNRPGDLVEINAETCRTLPPIATVLGAQAGADEVPVQLTALLTEVGTLEMNAVATDDSDRRWQLAFQLRGDEQATELETAHPRFPEAAERIERLYGSRSKDVGPKEIKTLRADLDKILGKRDSWTMPLLRALFGAFWEGARRRRRSVDHERLWFNLAGYCLRPGFGHPLDEWRVQQIWSLYEQGVQFSQDAQVWAEWWTLWRRIAGGLDETAQIQVLNDIAEDLKPQAKLSKAARGKSSRKPGYDDKVRLAASLELLPAERKTEVGQWLLQRLKGKEESPQTWWAVGRLGARVPFYGSAHNVVSRETAADWLQQALRLDWYKIQPAAFAAVMLARLSGDRERDLDDAARTEVITRLKAAKAAESWIEMVEEVVELEEADERQMFGEALPAGLRLVH